MAKPVEIQLEAQPLQRYSEILGPGFRRVSDAATAATRRLKGRVIWNVNSTARGGGVAEMLRAYLPYLLDQGIDTRWVVLQEEAPFFALTKRLHNNFHGHPGDGGPLGIEEKAFYLESLSDSAGHLEGMISPDDVVILHDPQTAGLIPSLRELGATVIWRCHIGTDDQNEKTTAAQAFLIDEVLQANASIFSRASYVWPGLPDGHSHIIPPGIDAFTPKNQEMDEMTRDGVLGTVGLYAERPRHQPSFTKADGTEGKVRSAGSVVQEQHLPPDRPLVVQVSRWDALKDHAGLLTLFAEDVGNAEAHLALVGPDSAGVDDDPEGAAVYADVLGSYQGLPEPTRRRVHLVSLPMDDLDENGFMVNAIQRRAEVLVQKSLAEGFGLTVSEGMWKSRPMVASRVGGIQDQITNERSGILIDDPADLPAFARAIDGLLADPLRAGDLGRNAKQTVKAGLLSVQRLVEHYRLIERLTLRPRP